MENNDRRATPVLLVQQTNNYIVAATGPCASCAEAERVKAAAPAKWRRWLGFGGGFLTVASGAVRLWRLIFGGHGEP